MVHRGLFSFNNVRRFWRINWGKKMSFRAIIVVGNEQGKVGVGVGKAGDVVTAVRKGVTDGKRDLSRK